MQLYVSGLLSSKLSFQLQIPLTRDKKAQLGIIQKDVKKFETFQSTYLILCV